MEPIEQLIERLEFEIDKPSNYDFERMGHKVLSDVERSRGTALGAKLRHGLPLSDDELVAGHRILGAAYHGVPARPSLVERVLDRQKIRENRELRELIDALNSYVSRPTLEPLETQAAPAAAEAGSGHDIDR